MFTPDKPHVLTLLVGVAIGGIALALTQFAPPLRAQEPARSDGTGQKQWAAVAPGRVEAASGEIKIGAPVVGRVAQVLVKPNDKVFAGEVLIRLDDDEALARLTFPRRRPPRASAPATINRRREGQANGARRRINLAMPNWRLPMRAPNSTRRRPTDAPLAVRRRILTRRALRLSAPRITCVNSAPNSAVSRRIQTRLCRTGRRASFLPRVPNWAWPM